MSKPYAAYTKRETAEVGKFVDSLVEQSTSGATFDSAAAADFIATATKQSGSKIPATLQAVFDEAGDKSPIITRAILDGVAIYRSKHGAEPAADLMEQAFHNAYATTEEARRKFSLDSATSMHQDNLSLQPNRAIVAILSMMSEAFPAAHYLPSDIGSNEAVLAIMSHNAGNTYGGYAEGGLMDGILSGEPYVTSSRVHKCAIDGSGNMTGKLTAVQTDEVTCDAAAAVVKLIRGRTIVYVNGVQAAKEVDQTGSGASAVSGSVTIAGTTHQIAGTVNTDTGVIALTSSPALANTVPVVVEGFIDYERVPELAPSIITAVNTYRLYAKPWRVLTRSTIDSRTQMSNELGLDPYSESVLAIQQQFANERHYEILAKARRIAANNQDDFDFEWSARSAQMNRSQIWLDFAAVLGKLSQQMAVDTMNHGITHLYVGRNLAAQFMALGRDVFEPSGIAEQPRIFRIGRLFGRFEVYYTPKGITETSSSSQILCIGRATDVTRNPFILGDAVSPTVIPLAVNSDLNQGAGFYARNFTAVNPHAQSARGCAQINITNLI